MRQEQTLARSARRLCLLQVIEHVSRFAKLSSNDVIDFATVIIQVIMQDTEQ